MTSRREPKLGTGRGPCENKSAVYRLGGTGAKGWRTRRLQPIHRRPSPDFISRPGPGETRIRAMIKTCRDPARIAAAYPLVQTGRYQAGFRSLRIAARPKAATPITAAYIPGSGIER